MSGEDDALSVVHHLTGRDQLPTPAEMSTTSVGHKKRARARGVAGKARERRNQEGLRVAHDLCASSCALADVGA